MEKPKPDKMRRNLGMAGMALVAQLATDAALAESKKPAHTKEAQRIELIAKPKSIDQVKQARLQAMIASAQAKLQSQDVKDALEGKGSNVLGRVLQAMELPIIGDDLTKTSLDPIELHRRYPVQVTYDGRGYKGINPSYGNTKSDYATEGNVGYGNGFYLGRNDQLVITNHTRLSLMGQKKHLESGGRDVGVLTFSPGSKAHPDQVIPSSTLKDKDVDGSLVTVIGIDPDATANQETTADKKKGHKTLPGIAIKLRPAMIEQLFRNPNLPDREKWLEHAPNFFIMIFPPGESMASANGLSGSAVFKGNALAGILNATNDIKLGNRTVTIALFHGIDAIQEELKNPKTITVNDSTIGKGLQ